MGTLAIVLGILGIGIFGLSLHAVKRDCPEDERSIKFYKTMIALIVILLLVFLIQE